MMSDEVIQDGSPTCNTEESPALKPTLALSPRSKTDLFINLNGLALTGLCSEVAFHPLDTIKTRLQCKKGFLKTGGFKRIYSGVGAVTIGSVPNTLLLYGSYSAVKSAASRVVPEKLMFGSHIIAALGAELITCIVRVPMEVVKQRVQVNQGTMSQVVSMTIKQEGYFGFYRGMNATFLRNSLFAVIHLPVWEVLKLKWSGYVERDIKSWESGVCGAISGALAGAATTPYDVAKTRIILASSDSKNFLSLSIKKVLDQIKAKDGRKAMHAGFLPRVMGASLSCFFTVMLYEQTILVLKHFLNANDKDR